MNSYELNSIQWALCIWKDSKELFGELENFSEGCTAIVLVEKWFSIISKFLFQQGSFLRFSFSLFWPKCQFQIYSLISNSVKMQKHQTTWFQTSHRLLLNFSIASLMAHKSSFARLETSICTIKGQQSWCYRLPILEIWIESYPVFMLRLNIKWYP